MIVTKKQLAVQGLPKVKTNATGWHYCNRVQDPMKPEDALSIAVITLCVYLLCLSFFHSEFFLALVAFRKWAEEFKKWKFVLSFS